MSRRGNCWDNAPVESFFDSLKTELLPDKLWNSHQRVKSALFEYIEIFYNRQRLHSTLDYMSPVEYELGDMKKAA